MTFNLKLEVDPDSAVPIYKQLFDRLKEAIISLELMPGEMLPSSRELAKELSLSRKTINHTYEELLSQGYIETVDGVGTFVSNRGKPKLALSAETKKIELSQYAQRLIRYGSINSSQGDYSELNYGACPTEALPMKSWRQILLKYFREYKPEDLACDVDPFGYLPLREALSIYLERTRALTVSPDQILTFSRSLQPLNLIVRLLIDQGDYIAVENPGFTFARQAFLSQGTRLQPVGVDKQGIIVDELFALDPVPKLVYVSSSHQDPTGVMLSLERRKRLLEWANRKSVLIVEDDYDCEYRYIGSNLPALMSLDTTGTVLYIGSFWKTLGPIIDAGFLVIPPSLIDRLTQLQSISWAKAHTTVPMAEQMTLTEFLKDGHLEKHVRKWKPIFQKRYQMLVHAFTKQFGSKIEFSPEPSGMHVIIRFKTTRNDDEIMLAAKQAFLSLVPTTDYYYEHAPTREYIVPFAHINENTFESIVQKFFTKLHR